jgi:hypothetical protein
MVVMFASMVVICLLSFAQVYGLWLNKADLVKWGIQLVSDSSAHMLSYLWQAWKTTAAHRATHPLCLSQSPWFLQHLEHLVPMVRAHSSPCLSQSSPWFEPTVATWSKVPLSWPSVPHSAKIDRVFWLIVISLIIVTVIVKAIECALASPTYPTTPQTAEIETQHNSDCELCRTNEVLLMDTIPKARHYRSEHDA